MITAGATTIRDLFSKQRRIDRPIEKVIDYYATDEHRLLAEVEEYEVTENVERDAPPGQREVVEGVRLGEQLRASEVPGAQRVGTHLG